MLSMKKTKNNLTRRLAPFFLKEFLRFLNFYTKITVKGLDSNRQDKRHRGQCLENIFARKAESCKNIGSG